MTFVNTMHLEFKYISGKSGICGKSTFADREASTPIYKPSKVYQIITTYFFKINYRTKFANKIIQFIVTSEDIVQYLGVNVNRDRLSEWGPSGHAIVGSA